jgi:hypothetical protein
LVGVLEEELADAWVAAAASECVDHCSYLFVTRSRDAKRRGDGAEPAIRLGDRLIRAVESCERCNKAEIESRRGGDTQSLSPSRRNGSVTGPQQSCAPAPCNRLLLGFKGGADS